MATTRTPSTATKPVEFDRSALAELTRGLVLGLSHLAHSYLARTDAQRQMDLWIADDDDQEAIADPLVSMAARHGGPEMGNPDVADLLAAGFALAGYGMKNVRKAIAARKAAKRLRGALPDLVEHPAADAAA